MTSAMAVPPPRLSPSREQATIRTLRQAHNAALAAGDVDGIVHLATDDFVMILGGGQILQGKPAYRAFVTQAFADPQAMRFVRIPDRIDVGTGEGHPVAAETGRWTGTAGDGSGARIAGRYLIHWTRQSGAWRIASETYVTVD